MTFLLRPPVCLVQALVDGGGVPALVQLLPAGGDLATAAAGVLRELCALRCGRVRSLSLAGGGLSASPHALPAQVAKAHSLRLILLSTCSKEVSASL